MLRKPPATWKQCWKVATPVANDLEWGHPWLCKRSWMGSPLTFRKKTYLQYILVQWPPPLSWQPAENRIPPRQGEFLYGTNHIQHWNIIVGGVLLIDWKIALCFTVNTFPTTFCTCSRFCFTHKDDNTWCNSQKVPAGGHQGPSERMWEFHCVLLKYLYQLH